MYDPAVARWFVIDALADQPEQIFRTPYQYAWNNPIYYNDPDGNCPWCLGVIIGGGLEYASQVAVNVAESGFTVESFTNVDGGKILISAATGALTGGLSAVNVVGTTAKVYKGVALAIAAGAGNIVKQQVADHNKALDPKDLALDVIGEVVPFKVKVLDEISENTIKTAERQLDRATRVAGDNPRPSRAQKVENAQKNVDNLKAQNVQIKQTNKTTQQVAPVLDAVIKTSVKEEIKTQQPQQ